MRAILLAGGFGKRLRPITKNIPKCLVPIKGIPLLEIWLKKLKDSKIKNVLINTHYLNDKVEDFIKKKNFGINIILSHEKKLLGTAGTFLKNIKFYGSSDGLLIHADNYSNEPLSNLVNAHKKRPKNCFITALTFKTNKTSSCGIFKVDNKNIVKNFYEKSNLSSSEIGNIANGAIYVLSKKFILNAKKKFPKAKDFSNHIIPKMKGKIFIYNSRKKFADIGTLNSYNKLK